MNGATALDCENTINRPNSTKTTTIGTSQYFFSCLRNLKNSPSTRLLLIPEPRSAGLQPRLSGRREGLHHPHLKHPVVMFSIAIAGRVRGPSRPAIAAARERVPPHQPPDEVDRREHDNEQQGKPETRHHVAEGAGKRPPVTAGPPQQ